MWKRSKREIDVASTLRAKMIEKRSGLIRREEKGEKRMKKQGKDKRNVRKEKKKK